MGGALSKKDLLNEDQTGPDHHFQLEGEYDWIHGGMIPAFKTIIKFLKQKEIKRIVSLTIEPVKIGRNINHQQIDFSCAEWVDSDLDIADFEGFEMIHVPISDGCFPNEENARKLLEIGKESKEKNIGTYFHCWAGRGRTCTSIMHVLMQIYGKDVNESSEIIKKVNENFDLKPAQLSFLNKDENYCNYLPAFYEPLLLTPRDAKCYTEHPLQEKEEEKEDEDEEGGAKKRKISEETD